MSKDKPFHDFDEKEDSKSIIYKLMTDVDFTSLFLVRGFSLMSLKHSNSFLNLDIIGMTVFRVTKIILMLTVQCCPSKWSFTTRSGRRGTLSWARTWRETTCG